MKVSVIVPVYNVEQYLEQCLNSIINQSYYDLEIILVNDGSEDQSPKICDDFANKDSRVKVIHQKNGGVSSARNTGIKAATGDFITFVDSDDWLDKQMYQKMIETTDVHQNVELIMCDFINEKNCGKEKINANIRKGFYDKEGVIKEIYPTLLVTEDLGRLPIVSACICLFKKDLLRDNKIDFDESLRYAEDYLFMANVILHTKYFFYLKENYFYHYRQYELSRSKKYQPQWWDNFLSLNNNLKELLSVNKDFNFSRQIKFQLIHSALYVSSAIFNDKNIKNSKKLIFLKKLFNDSYLRAAFSNIKFNKQSFTLKIVLYLVKFRMFRTFLYYRCFVSKIKLLIKK